MEEEKMVKAVKNWLNMSWFSSVRVSEVLCKWGKNVIGDKNLAGDIVLVDMQITAAREEEIERRLPRERL